MLLCLKLTKKNEVQLHGEASPRWAAPEIVVVVVVVVVVVEKKRCENES